MSPFRFSLLSESQRVDVTNLLNEWENAELAKKKSTAEALYNYLQDSGIVISSRIITCCSTWLDQATGWTQYAIINNWKVDE